MTKNVLFVLITGALLLSACAPQTPESVDMPEADTPMETIVDVEAPEPEPETPMDLMPCTTVFDYQTTAETDQLQAVVDQLPPVTNEDWIKGNPDAPITIVEYADFQCPACVGFAAYVQTLMEEFPTSIRHVFRQFPLPAPNDRSVVAAMATEAAGAQGKFWEMKELLFETQGQWRGLSDDQFLEWLMTQADALGLDIEQFERDLLDENARAALEEQVQASLDLGVRYTPFVAVNNRIFRDNRPDLFSLIGIHEFGGSQTCPPWVIDPDRSYTARLDTNAGEIEFLLYADAAPLAVNSFVFLSQNGWFDQVYFHRVIPGFVAQAGDPSGLGMIGPGYKFANETDNNLSFDRAGILGMANAGVDTNGSQFFITLAPVTNLDGDYTIFGEVSAESMDVLSEIATRDPQTTVGFEGATVITGIEIIEE